MNNKVLDFTDENGNVTSSAPSSLRMFASTILGVDKPITESDFRQDELDVIRNAVEKAKSEGTNVIGYGDYGEDVDWVMANGNKQALNALTKTPHSVAFTLGMATFEELDDGSIVITDEYDFGADKETVRQKIDERGILQSLMDGLVSNGLTGVGNVIGNMTVPRGSGRKVRIVLKPKT